MENPMLLNNLDPSPAALVRYVRQCGVKFPILWLNRNVPNWRGPVPPAQETELADDDRGRTE